MKQLDFIKLEEHGITEVKPGLFTAEVTSPQGEIFYLGYEKIVRQEQLDFWSNFKNTLQKKGGGYILFAWLFEDIKRNRPLPDYPQSYSAAFESERAYKQAVEKVKNSRNQGAGYASIHMDIAKDALNFFDPELSTDDKDNFVIYASKIPILDYRCNTPIRHTPIDKNTHEALIQRNNELGRNYKVDNLSEVLDFIANYGDLLMCVGAHTANGSCSITHMGIFRNSYSLLEPGDKYKNISLIVQGFGAIIAHQLFHKILLVFAPVLNMQNVLFKAIDQNKFIVGHQKDWPEKLKKLFLENKVDYPEGIKNLHILFHQPQVDHSILHVVALSELEPSYQQAKTSMRHIGLIN